MTTILIPEITTNNENDMTTILIPEISTNKEKDMTTILTPEITSDIMKDITTYEIKDITTYVENIKVHNKDNYINIPSLFNTTNNTVIYDIILENLLPSFEPDNDIEIVSEAADDVIFQITTSKNQLKALTNSSMNNYNLSILDISNCEAILKEKYNLNENVSLIILKKEKKSNKASEREIQLEIYEPYNKTKLNLSFCQDTSINIYVKAELSDETKYSYEKLKSLGYDIFNLNDPFYQDICIDYTSYGNTDMSLSDRINYIYNNDDTRCQPNCKATKFSPESEYLNCSCNINEEVNNMKQKFKPKKIYESFYDVLKYSNYKILKCYNLVFTEFLMTKNKGGIIVFIFILINLGCLILFIIKRINPLKNKLKLKIENQINNNNDINNMNNNDINNMNNNDINNMNNNDLNNMNSNDINNMNSNDLNFMNNKDIIINNKVDINKMNIDGFIISRKMDIYKGSSKLLKKDNPPKRRSFIQTHKLNKDISDTNTINNLNKESLAKKINVKKIKIIRRNSSRRFSLNLDGKTSLWDNSINRINNLAIPKPKEKINIKY